MSADIYAFARPKLTVQAKGQFPEGSASRKFEVLEGSQAVYEASPGIHFKRDSKVRKELISKGILKYDARTNFYQFKQNYTFSSASRAAGVIIDGNCSGLKYWKKLKAGEDQKFGGR